MPCSSERLLQLLQQFFKSSIKVQQIHALLITDSHLLHNSHSPRNLKWMPTLLFNSLIRAYLTFRQPHAAIFLFSQMLTNQTKPNSHTFPPIIKSAAIFSPSLCRPIHAQAFKIGVLSDPFVRTSLVGCYSELAELPDARKVFDEIPNPCIVAFNSMLDAFAKNGDLGSAVSMFEAMPERDVVSWTSFINGFWWNECFLEAILCFEKMVECLVKPNEATFVSVLSSCANLDFGGAVCLGREIHAHVIRNELSLAGFLGTAMIDFYGKKGFLECARSVFNQVRNKEVCAWNAMISSFSSNGQETEALDMFGRMKVEGILPNKITFVAILTACARGKLVEFGLQVFRSMKSDFDVEPVAEHYACVVDLLGRAGRLRDAMEFIESMPFEPDASVLGALLGACKTHGAIELGNEVGRRLLVMQPRHCGRYVALASINAGVGKWDRAAGIRMVMAEAGVKKVSALSRISLL